MFEFASYAAPQAWARARRSGLISPPLWRRMLEADTLDGLVAIARETRYGSGVTSDPVRAEKHLGRVLAEETYALKRFVSGRARPLLAWHARRPELDNLKTVLRALHYRQPLERATSSLVPLPHSPLDWVRLLASSDVAAFVEQLQGSVYAKPLEDALERYRQEGLPFFLEISLDLAYLRHLLRLIARLGSGDRRQAQRFLGFSIDVHNLLWAYRYRIYARLAPEEILNYTLHRAYRVDIATLRRVVTGAPLQEEAARLGLRVGAELSEREALERVELESRRLLFARAAESFRGLTFHLGSVLAYGALVEAEVADLVTLLEGKAQGMSAADLVARMIRGVPSVPA
jgi:V/A-type H+-transporting ATPase subunit C